VFALLKKFLRNGKEKKEKEINFSRSSLSGNSSGK
jgi:hypothetical protein